MHFEKPQWRESSPSTNSEVIRMLESGAELASGYVLAVREQTAGRGRLQRTWESDAGKDLCFSFVLRTKKEFPQLVSLPMAVALGIVELLREMGVNARCKWPNDVLVPGKEKGGALGKKISGVLPELGPRTEIHGEMVNTVVVGVGLNVNMDVDSTEAIDRPATSLLLETGMNYDVEEVLNRLLATFPKWIERWEQDVFSGISQEWTELSVPLVGDICVRDGGKEQSGTHIGYGESGELLVRDSKGVVHPVWAGDIFEDRG